MSSSSQVDDPVVATIAAAAAKTLKKGTGDCKRGSLTARDFNQLVAEVAIMITRPVRRQVKVSKGKIKNHLRDVLAKWHEARVLVMKDGVWRFYASQVHLLSEAAKPRRTKPVGDAPPRYFHRQRPPQAIRA